MTYPTYAADKMMNEQQMKRLGLWPEEGDARTPAEIVADRTWNSPKYLARLIAEVERVKEMQEKESQRRAEKKAAA